MLINTAVLYVDEHLQAYEHFLFIMCACASRLMALTLFDESDKSFAVFTTYRTLVCACALHTSSPLACANSIIIHNMASIVRAARVFIVTSRLWPESPDARHFTRRVDPYHPYPLYGPYSTGMPLCSQQRYQRLQDFEFCQKCRSGLYSLWRESCCFGINDIYMYIVQVHMWEWEGEASMVKFTKFNP